MTPDILKFKIQAAMPDATVFIESDGTHYFATVISKAFIGKSRIAKQQLVYQTVQAELQNGALHALSLQTWTPKEWEIQSSKNHSGF